MQPLPQMKFSIIQPDSFSTVGVFSTVDAVVDRIYVQCKY